MRNWIKRFLKIFLAVGLSFIISGFIFADEESHTVEAYTLNKQIVIDPLTYSFEYENDYRDEMYFTIDATPEGVSKYFGRNNAATFKVGNDLVVKLYYIASPFSGGELNMFVEITGNIDEKWQFEFQESSINYSGTFATIKNRFYYLTFFPNFDEPETSTEKGKVFVEKAQKLPSVSQLKNMTQTQFNRAANEIAATRAYYNKLSHSERDLTYPWDYYLEQKEDIVGQSFIYEVKQLPNSGDITSLLSNEVIGLQYRMDDLQNKYNRLSTNAKNNPEVSKWYGYFKIKKDILYNNSDVSLTPLHFVHEAKKLPNVSEINRMSLSQLDALDAEIARVFDLYERMNGFNEQSGTWLEHLVDKANAVSKRKFSLRYESEAIHSFLDHAKALPNNSEIEEMAIIQLEQTKQAISEVRNLYNKLTGEEKADTRVVNWVGFLNAKETAVNNGLASEKELFSDLSSSHWAFNRVMSLHEMGIINGYRDGRFGTKDSLSRGQASSMIVKGAAIDYKGKRADFTDVSDNNEFSSFIAGLVDVGAVSGYRDGRFGPNDKITRGQIAAIVVRAFDLTEGTVETNFPDVSNSEFQGFIHTLASNGIVGGYADGRYGPDNAVTRAEFSVILSKAMEVSELN